VVQAAQAAQQPPRERQELLSLLTLSALLAAPAGPYEQPQALEFPSPQEVPGLQERPRRFHYEFPRPVTE
jgi:hypothetical protein